MIHIFLFEMKKIFKSTFFFIMLLLFCLFILGYYVFVYNHTVQVEELVTEIESRVHIQEKSIQELKSLSGDSEIDSQLEQDIQFQEEYLAREMEGLKAYQNEEWHTILNQEIEISMELGAHSPNREYRTSTFPTNFTSDTHLDYNKWLRDKGIPPALPIDIHSWITLYDIDFGDHPDVERFIKDRSSKYFSSGIYFLHHFIELLFGLIGPVFFLLLLGDIITKEGLGKSGPIHLLKTQPITPHKILLSKLFAVLVATVLIFLGTNLFAILIGTIFDRFGNWDYPVLIYGEDYTYNFMEMGTFFLHSAVMSLLVLLFCYSLLFLFSVMTKKTLLAVGLTIAAIFIGIQWSGESSLSAFTPYIPFHYFSVSQIITNELAVTLNNYNFSYTTGLVVLSVYSIIILLLTYLVSAFKNKMTH